MATPLLHLPYFEGEAWWCSQGNNETCSECTHRPGSTIRYAWDFNWGNGNDDFGRAVAAPAGGEITVARWESSGWGNCVEIKYGEDSYGWLAHLEKIFVRKGEHVKASQIIGLCGNSGTSSAHIHYHTSESSRGSSVPSSFIRWGNPPGGNSSTTYPSQNSQLFNEAYNRNGGHGRMGPAIDGIHWYYDFNRQGQDCYIQRYDRGSFGPCAIVYDALGGAHSAYV
ncbi:MAG: peptidase family M23, partial [uncultured bacterium]